MKIFLISGKAQHGKDYTAKVLKNLCEEKDLKVLILHYGDYLKYLCKEVFSWDGQKDETGRHILQKVGTNLARENNPDIWVNVVAETIDALRTEFDVFIVPDTRFPNEVEVIVDRFGFSNVESIRVVREGFESNLTDEQKNHPNETALDNYYFDHIIRNTDGVESVIKNIKESGIIG